MSKQKLTIAELELLLERNEEEEFEILPNGEIRAKGSSDSMDLGGRKPITWRENFRGDY
jgi:hypothetical protein